MIVGLKDRNHRHESVCGDRGGTEHCGASRMLTKKEGAVYVADDTV